MNIREICFREYIKRLVLISCNHKVAQILDMIKDLGNRSGSRGSCVSYNYNE